MRFAETRWTQVILAKGSSDEAKMALGELCEAYYAPVFRFIEERCHRHESASDLTQAFFERVLERYGFAGADPERGRFRTFLLGAVKHFLSENRAFEDRKKRGGGVPHESLDAPGRSMHDSTSPGLQVADVSAISPDVAFDRHFAHAVLERTLTRLEAEFLAEGKAAQFTALQPWLAGGAEISQAETAYELGLSESAIRVAVHRLRQRFRACLRAELAQTLAPGIAVDEELRHLFASLR